MSFRNISCQEWDSLGDAERVKLSERLAASLPQAIKFIGVAFYQLGPVSHSVAEFQFNSARFVLVPGGSPDLGYDAQKFLPTTEQLDSFNDTAKRYRIQEDLQSFIQKLSTPPRTGKLDAILVEAEPREIGIVPISPEDPKVQEVLERHRRLKKKWNTLEVYKTIRLQRKEDGSVQAWRIVPKSHDEICQELDVEGLRLLTSDEWEFSCGAGARTLFRWGDICPCDRDPIDKNPGWDIHLQPNAFGLTIAKNPYDLEVVAEKGVLRGGDGGCNICGGVGYFLSWLPLATAYFDRSICEEIGGDMSNMFMRRVIPL